MKVEEYERPSVTKFEVKKMVMGLPKRIGAEGGIEDGGKKGLEHKGERGEGKGRGKGEKIFILSN